MAKVKKTFVCHQCGTDYPKWQGRCNACGEWNTIEEEIVQATGSRAQHEHRPGKATPIAFFDVPEENDRRLVLADAELNRVLGGGVVEGSVILIGGEPGIGKSTLMLQVAMENQTLRVLYVSGEESLRQIRMRGERIGQGRDTCFLLADTLLENIIAQAFELKPDLMVIDSVQTLYAGRIEAAPGTITQIRECTMDITRYAKDTGTPVFLIGHITKDGNIAGPKILEHMVDTVLQFEGDRNHVYRILRAHKNRFGSTNEIGIYEMAGTGLRQVADPSEVLLSQGEEALSGVAVACSMEGMRPLMIEVQALVSMSAYGTPQRASTGFDIRRLNMLLAVLEKRCGVKLGNRDVFLNITGGIRVDDPAIDLAVVCAVLSSQADMALAGRVCFAAEIGLSGEVRPVQRLEQRVAEAARLGYDRIIVSRYSRAADQLTAKGIEVVKAGKIEEVFRLLF
jgi:DNA repair protein RadA/Sms